MYMGKEVERATTVELFKHPKHPYTTALLGSIPNIGEKKDQLATIAGMVPSPFNLPSGCVFHPRCPAHAVSVTGSIPIMQKLRRTTGRVVSYMMAAGQTRQKHRQSRIRQLLTEEEG
jgi:oligopeptide/dipeptide ABC transporter ATP-binding protein